MLGNYSASEYFNDYLLFSPGQFYSIHFEANPSESADAENTQVKVQIWFIM
jgi:hypothetical protein